MPGTNLGYILTRIDAFRFFKRTPPTLLNIPLSFHIHKHTHIHNNFRVYFICVCMCSYRLFFAFFVSVARDICMHACRFAYVPHMKIWTRFFPTPLVPPPPPPAAAAVVVESVCIMCFFVSSFWCVRACFFSGRVSFRFVSSDSVWSIKFRSCRAQQFRRCACLWGWRCAQGVEGRTLRIQRISIRLAHKCLRHKLIRRQWKLKCMLGIVVFFEEILFLFVKFYFWRV